jgi:hypothetical protein
MIIWPVAGAWAAVISGGYAREMQLRLKRKVASRNLWAGPT